MFPHAFCQENLLRYERHFFGSPSRWIFFGQKVLRHSKSNKLVPYCQSTMPGRSDFLPRLRDTDLLSVLLVFFVAITPDESRFTPRALPAPPPDNQPASPRACRSL